VLPFSSLVKLRYLQNAKNFLHVRTLAHVQVASRSQHIQPYCVPFNNPASENPTVSSRCTTLLQHVEFL
jgi:hypothetical protein